MATKWRNIRLSAVTKTAVWLLLAICLYMGFHGGLRVAYEGEEKGLPLESVFISEYTRSPDYKSFLWQTEDTFISWLETSTGEAVSVSLPYGIPACHYYAKNQYGAVVTNAPAMAPEAYLKQKHFLTAVFRDGVYTYETSDRDFEPFRWSYYSAVENGEFYFAFDDNTIAGLQTQWNEAREYYLNGTGQTLVWLGASVLLLVYLCAAAGRRGGDRELHTVFVDRLWSEIILTGLFFAGVMFCLVVVAIADSSFSTYYIDAPLLIAGYAAAFTLSLLAFTCATLSVVRKIKAKNLISHSLTVIILKWCFRFLKAIWLFAAGFFDGRAYRKYPLTKSLFLTQLTYICTSAVLLFFSLLIAAESREFGIFLFFFLLELPLTAWYIMGNRWTHEKINAGFSRSIHEQTKAENTKTALITNVSHDLKTPLTSIISYIDLLSKEENLSDAARDYVTVIAQKSERLKHIVSDLFDLSKSTTGNLQLDMECLDLKKLVEQTVADMRDAIDASGLVFRVKTPGCPVFIFSDGRKLYRAFQNILDNAMKYSLAGTRVFLSLESDGKEATACLKNTAGYEMEFSAEEVLQRFVRGDAARGNDGSGLGLSIAESFVKACGGDFKVEIDGDLFKVTIRFMLFEGEESNEPGKGGDGQ